MKAKISFDQQGIQSFIEQVESYIDNVKTGSLPGYTTGFDKIDRFAGRLEPGQVWIIGGSSGVGKSYFVLNMINNFLEAHPGLKTHIYSTELSDFEYLNRHTRMRAEMYKHTFQQNPAAYEELYKKALYDYGIWQAKTNYSLKVFGGISEFNEILTGVRTSKPDVLVIDYLQEISYKDLKHASDVMPVIASQLKSLALSMNMIVIAISQVSNKSQDKNYKNTAAPFDYGKEFNRAAQTSILLERRNHNGILSRVLEANIIKARDGETGTVLFEIKPGYKLAELNREQALDIIKREEDTAKELEV